MAAIYIHIPFCRKACTYCDFHFVTSLKQKKNIVEAIQQELSIRKNFFPKKDDSVQTIYFGGGTPSVLEPAEIQAILNTIYKHYVIDRDSINEITLECNPEDLTEEYIIALKDKTDINRISIGIQSFIERDLQWMNRGHSATSIDTIIQHCRREGFKNITIDLILGIPNLTEEEWRENLFKAVSLDIEHLSVYALTVEAKTTLAHQVRKNRVQMPDDEAFEKQFMITHEVLTQAGYLHYELSNYAKPKFLSVHNRSYWKGTHYLGVGPSAHSYDGKERTWNLANNFLYLQKIKEGQEPTQDTELLTDENRYNEYIMTHLRIAEGLDTEYMKITFGKQPEQLYPDIIREMLTSHYLYQENARLKPTLKGWMVSDYLASELFI